MSQSGKLKVRIESATPNPPAKTVNAWVIRVFDAQTGAALTGARVAVSTYMPCHGHPGVPSQVVANADGTYAVNNLDLFMAGVWRISVTLPDRGTDVVEFFFCVQG